MPPLKLYYLSAEVAPFSETYALASFSRKITTKLHDKSNIDIRISKPKYGYVSERKYILREVIRLKDLNIKFLGKEYLINIKSAFIPNTRAQIYFLEYNDYYFDLPELLYKSRNGRYYKDNDEKFARALGKLGDAFVNDAFSVAHRAHASTEGLARIMPAAA